MKNFENENNRETMKPSQITAYLRENGDSTFEEIFDSIVGNWDAISLYIALTDLIARFRITVYFNDDGLKVYGIAKGAGL